MSPIAALLSRNHATGSTPLANASIVVNWSAPQTLADGSASPDIAGYRVSWGANPGLNLAANYTGTADVGVVSTYTITSLLPGTWYVAIQTKNAAGALGEYSNEIAMVAA